MVSSMHSSAIENVIAVDGLNFISKYPASAPATIKGNTLGKISIASFDLNKNTMDKI